MSRQRNYREIYLRLKTIRFITNLSTSSAKNVTLRDLGNFRNPRNDEYELTTVYR